jgi:GrpB-like predicted nucleotidyltransferase (UPF0157 family)
MIVVSEYDPAWPRAFARIRSRIAPVLAGVAIAIEHVGSTSVPGLSAKPIVDIDVIVRADGVAAAIERLASLGYEHQGDLGVPQREAFRHAHAPAHHLYVCVEGRPHLLNHLAFRDALRADSELAREYGNLKRELARRFPNDIDAYVAGKTAFVTSVLERTGAFSATELAAIERLSARP